MSLLVEGGMNAVRQEVYTPADGVLLLQTNNERYEGNEYFKITTWQFGIYMVE
ncbi:MAG: hypothetical protein HFE49_10020 [Clostridia bacterium]|nr:hypothetical protein [Clostridia bacterium]